MDLALAFSALLMGLAGSPHCVAMCGAACTAIAGRCGGQRPQPALLGLHAGRLLSYAAGGAVVAGGVGALAALAAWSPSLRPLWTLVHVAALGLGVWLLWTGRQPAFLDNLGRGPARELASAKLATAPGAAQPVAVLRLAAGQGPGVAGAAAVAGGGVAGGAAGPVKAAAAGALWLGLPCGLLHSALVMAALANTPVGGAAIMAAFALGTTLGLWIGPTLWWRVGAPGGGWLARGGAVRLAGLMLIGVSAWALGHDLGASIGGYCLG
jgi:sulfite exporter TauE/SafE